MEYLHQSLESTEVNSYQLQAGIAAEYCLSPDFASTNWESIFKQYGILEKLNPSPVVHFNKCVAQFYMGAREEAVQGLDLLAGEPSLQRNIHYHTAQGIFLGELHQKDKAVLHLTTALSLARSMREEKRLTQLLSYLS